VDDKETFSPLSTYIKKWYDEDFHADMAIFQVLKGHDLLGSTKTTEVFFTTRS
jgi:hypothetical protein